MAARNVYVQMSKLPSFSKLNEKVKEVERAAPWWELYGVEWVHVGGGVGAAAAGLLMLQAGGGLDTALGFILLGFCHTIITQKAGHLAAHGALARSKRWNKFWCVLFVEFLGGYSEYMGYAIHIKCHHPHTNIIGLGDSSSWKLPGLSRVPYMFLAPLLLPILLPLVSLQQLLESKAYWAIAKFIPVALAGIAFRTSLFVYVSGYTVAKAFGAYLAYQAVFAINYIHINIFQHIGLPMYSQENRPVRIYQMSTGVLNLHPNLLLDLAFGHTLTDSHVEHHLFPRLSDNMCVKIKPLVKDYLVSNGLPYQEASYWQRLKVFMARYDELMVNAPPITHFVGLQ